MTVAGLRGRKHKPLINPTVLVTAVGGLLVMGYRDEVSDARGAGLADLPQQVITVNAAEIGTRITIIGQVGQPLGQWVTIRGRWVFPKAIVKRAGPDFVVSSVNGEILKRSFRFDQFHPLMSVDFPQDEAQEWDVVGYEAGGYRGRPPGEPGGMTKKDRTRPPDALIPVTQAFKFGFYTEFHYKTAKRVN